MTHHSPACTTSEVLNSDWFHVQRKVERRCVVDEREVVDPWSYRARLGKGTIRVQSVEFRILRFLASQPYRALTRREIAEAVSTDEQPVTTTTLGGYIRSLRDQLGFYADFIQKVPYIGYRFKA